MSKPSENHHLPNVPTRDPEPFEAFSRGYTSPNPDVDEPKSVPATHPLAQSFFTLAQAGKIFGKTPRTMRWWADTGRIQSIKIGASRFVTEAEIQRLQAGEGG
jgi:hypothetical protein